MRVTTNYQIVSVRPHHLDGIERLLRENFPENLLVRLCPEVVAEFLNSYISIPGGCGYVCVERGEVVGFVLGAEDVPNFRRTWLRRRWLPLALQVIRGVAVTPSLARRLLRNVPPYLAPARGRDGQSVRLVESETIPRASLFLLAVDSNHRRRKIAERLTNEFLHEMSQRGADRVKLTVAVNNRAAVSFYLDQGWQVARRYRAPEGRLVSRLDYRHPSFRNSDADVSA